MNYWLMKSETSAYSIDDLARDRIEVWDGVRNYQAHNYLRSMCAGDLAFFYHSNAAPPGVAGLMQIVEPEVVDPSQFDSQSHYHDPKAGLESPRWWTVRVGFMEKFPRLLTLNELKDHFTPEELPALKRGSRLSVLPVAGEIAERILTLARRG